jgi:nucleotide-binding universal stress UspA family protein
MVQSAFKVKKPMFTTIVVTSDGSNTADLLIAVAETLAKGSRTKVVVAHVNELTTARGALYSVRPYEDMLQRKVRLQVGDLKAAGFDAEAKILSTRGRAADSIAEVARDYKANLIVTGGSRHGRLASTLFGNVGQRMIRVAPCPVLVIPSHN